MYITVVSLPIVPLYQLLFYFYFSLFFSFSSPSLLSQPFLDLQLHCKPPSTISPNSTQFPASIGVSTHRPRALWFHRSRARGSNQYISVPLGTVSRIEKMGGQSTKKENAYGLEIHCKDMRVLRIAYPVRPPPITSVPVTSKRLVLG